MVETKFRVAMLPWFAMGHFTRYLNLSNKLAEKGHHVLFLIPPKSQNKFNDLNLHPHLIQSIPLTIPQVDGLPVGVESAADIPLNKQHPLLEAFDLTKDQVQSILVTHKPDIVFFDFASWIPSLAHPLGIKTIFFGPTASSFAGFIPNRQKCTEPLLVNSPPSLLLTTSHSKLLGMEEDGMISFLDRFRTALDDCDALCFRGCSEMEGSYADYISTQLQKQVFLIGPNLPEVSHLPLEEKWEKWLGDFRKGSVVYCAFGSECILEKDQFQELVLGLELTGLPFLVRLKPPFGFESLEEALPEGFEERVRGRGLVYGGWVQQQRLLSHPSVGCFLTHCGSNSMWESILSDCQIVTYPHFGDQFVNADFMIRELKVAVGVERREEDEWFTKESVCTAVKSVMDEENEVSDIIRTNHHKWKQFVLTQGLQSSHINNFIIKLQDMLNQS